MDCSNTSTSRSRKRRAGFTLVELLMASGLGTLVLSSVVTLSMHGFRSFAGLANYADLDHNSRNALDVMTQEIRQADRLVSGGEHAMAFRFSNPTNAALSWQVAYIYTPTSKTLSRIQGTERTVLLTECDFLQFSFFQRNPIGGTYDQYPTATPGTCKLVQMSWVCSRRIMMESVNTESVQSAKVVIRKE